MQEPLDPDHENQEDSISTEAIPSIRDDNISILVPVPALVSSRSTTDVTTISVAAVASSATTTTATTTIPLWLEDICHRLCDIQVLNLNIRRLQTLDMMYMLCDSLITNNTIYSLNLTTTLANASLSLPSYHNRNTISALDDRVIINRINNDHQQAFTTIAPTTSVPGNIIRKRKRMSHKITNDYSKCYRNYSNNELLSCFIDRILTNHRSLKIIHLSYNQLMECDNDLDENEDDDVNDDGCIAPYQRKNDDDQKITDIHDDNTPNHDGAVSKAAMNHLTCGKYKNNIKIGLALCTNTYLLELYLDHNHLTALSAYYISIGLQYNHSLQVLQLNDNRIGDEGCCYVSKALSYHNTTLKTLKLDHNTISDTGAKQLYETLWHHNTTIEHMTLYRNPAIIVHPDGDLLAQIDLLCQANRMGRHYIWRNDTISQQQPNNDDNDHELSLSLHLYWPILLEKMNANPSLMFYFIKHKPELMI